MFSNNFTVYDNTPNEENPNAPWLRLVHSCNLDDSEGTVAVEKQVRNDDDKPLLKMDVGPIDFKELDSKTEESTSWLDWSSDDKTMLAWEASRTVTVKADGEDAPVASISVTYRGTACCKKEVRRDADGDRDNMWTKWARTKEVTITVEVEGKKVNLEHHLGEDKGGENDWGQKYKIDGIFSAEYINKWGKDEILIQSEEDGEPLTAVAVGFVIAQWLHPKRVEDNACRKAEKILKDQQGWFE